jgi:PHD/YefM family antitoxin component YafN of YafNO toxin-antitoxin module
MSNTVIKDPDFPMRHAQVTELKNTAKIAEMAKDADILVTRNGETVAYLVNPNHYETLIKNWLEIRKAVTDTFLKSYEQQHGSLERLDEAISASRRGEFATQEAEVEVFGD